MKASDFKFPIVATFLWCVCPMSISRRHTPIAGITCAKSDKEDKRLASKRVRRNLGNQLQLHLASDPDFDLVDYDEHPRSGGWSFSKDGKVYFGNSLKWDIVKVMRK